MDKRAKKNKLKIMWKLKHGKYIPDLYVLALPLCDKNQIEVFASSLLIQQSYRELDPYIIGFAYGYGNAILIIKKITEKVYEKTGTGNIRQYIEAQK